MSRKLPEHMPKVKYCVVRKHKTVKLWILEFLGFRCGENKRRRKDEKRRAHYEKNREEIIGKVVEARKKSREAKSGQLRYVPIKDATKKCRCECNQQKLASENKGKLEREKVD